jgi:hypothetical protein
MNGLAGKLVPRVKTLTAILFVKVLTIATIGWVMMVRY